jgi:nicotinate dehydrogenase subunit B
MDKIPAFLLSRRHLLGAGGALIVSLSALRGTSATAAADAQTKPPLVPDELDSWIGIAQDGAVTAYFGKMDPGQGVDVAIAQIVADELDVPFERVRVIMGDTKYTVNQGGASGSTGVQRGGVTLRYAAAEARRVLLTMAAARLDAEPETLSVSEGMVSVAADPGKQVSYGELIGGRFFDVKLQWNGVYGNFLLAKGQAVPKRPDQYRIVGRSVPRADIGQKVFGRLDFVTEVSLPGMLHGRMLRPPVAGAVPVTVDEASISSLPRTRVVWRKGFLGVVAEKEWDAIRAAQMLHVTWSQVAPPFPDTDRLYGHIRDAPVLTRKVEAETGAVDAAMTGATHIIDAEYEWPFQSHASMGPACSVADVRPDFAMVWTGSQKPHFTRLGVAGITGLPAESVRSIWVRGPGCYGRNDAGDAALDAAVLSQAVGRPVRVQWARGEGHGWDPKGPASIHRGHAALDAQGNVLAYIYESKGFSRIDIDSTEADPRQSLAGQLMGLPLAPHQGFGVPGEAYTFANRRLAWETIPPLLDRASPLRSAHLRDPVGPQTNFGSESFIDELSVAAGADPVEFRLRNLTDPRAKSVISAAAERAGWQARPLGARGKGDSMVGRGIAYAQRSATYVAVIAEVEVDRRSGRVWPRRFIVAHDCGLIINPEGLRRCIEGNIVQGASRAIWEEVSFDRSSVTSLDWRTYPILGVADVPEEINIVTIDRPDVASGGAGEASTRPVAAAIGNAIFDATGCRLRRAPFRPERVKAALL